MIDKIIEQLASVGLLINRIEIDSHNIVRCKAEGDTGKKLSGWYRIYSVQSKNGNTYYVGSYGNWRNTSLPPEGLKIEFDKTTLSNDDLKAIKAKQQEAQIEAEAQKKKKALEAKSQALKIWTNATIADDKSVYLMKKKVSAFGLKTSRNSIIVPVKNIDNDILGLQFIESDGTKRFLSGTPKSGAFFIIGQIKANKPFLVCEGYATAASCHMATKLACIVAFDAGNLPKVAQAIKHHHPKSQLIIAADDDKAGIKYAQKAIEENGGLYLTPIFKSQTEDMSDFNDLHTKEGLEEVKNQIFSLLEKQPKRKPRTIKNKIIGRFKLNEQGVFYSDNESDSNQWLCSKLEIIARSRNEDSKEWGLLVSFLDHDGITRDWNIPSRLFASEGGTRVIEGLYDLGLKIAPNRTARKRLLEYLQSQDPETRVLLVGKLGWHSNAYLLPDCILGEPEQPLYYFSDKKRINKAGCKGTLTEWQNSIAQYSENNPLMMFCISSAFAAPLMNWLGFETFGFHIVGDSSLGKSTLAKVAASVIGSPEYLRTWHTTSTALEPTAAEHSDSLLILDEINQSDPYTVGQMVYMLGNEQGRARGTDTGSGTRTQHKWRLLFLSNGEKTLDEHIASVGKKTQVGMEMRLLSIPACTHKIEEKRKQQGIFDCLHTFNHGSALSDHLKWASTKYYGNPFKEFITSLTELEMEDRKKLIAHLQNKIRDFEKNHLSNEATGQPRRAIKRFALVGLAGELATQKGITGWKQGDAMKASETMFKQWLELRGGDGNLEDKNILNHIVCELQTKAESNFTRWDHTEEEPKVDTHQPRTSIRWGFRRVETIEKGIAAAADGIFSEETFYIYREPFKRIICKEFNYQRALQLLKDKDALETTKGRGYTKKVRLPGSGRKPEDVYLVKMSALKELV